MSETIGLIVFAVAFGFFVAWQMAEKKATDRQEQIELLNNRIYELQEEITELKEEITDTERFIEDPEGYLKDLEDA